jgi:hypothetical protein
MQRQPLLSHRSVQNQPPRHERHHAPRGAGLRLPSLGVGEAGRTNLCSMISRTSATTAATLTMRNAASISSRLIAPLSAALAEPPVPCAISTTGGRGQVSTSSTGVMQGRNLDPKLYRESRHIKRSLCRHLIRENAVDHPRATIDDKRTRLGEARDRQLDPHGVAPARQADEDEPRAWPSSDRQKLETTVNRVEQGEQDQPRAEPDEAAPADGTRGPAPAPPAEG